MERNNQKEIAGGADRNSASIGKGAASMENARAVGRYKVECTGPVERCRQRYIRLRDKIQAIKNQGPIRRLLQRGSLRHMMAELAAIPMELKWADDALNLVTTVGKNDMLDKYLAGSTYTAAWYVGLISLTSYTTGAAITDTMASHSGWAEDVEYSQAARPTAAWSAAAGGSKQLSAAAVFSINGDGTTIKGCFLNTVATKSGTTGTLFSAGLFSGGDKVLANGDTLNVSYTATLT